MSTSERGFPIGLLQQCVVERVEFFKGCILDHDTHEQGYEGTMVALSQSYGPRIVLLVGPTGAGKSTLAVRIEKQALVKYMDEALADRGTVPVMRINAIAPNGKSFDWKDFYIRLLSAYGDVLLDRKLQVSVQPDLFLGMGRISAVEGSGCPALRRALETYLKLRKTRVLIIDEAHHILMVNNPAQLEFQFETLKSLAIETNVVIVLVGTYRLLDICDQSGQLVRRSVTVHFPRYRPDRREDLESFGSVLKTLQRKLPLAKEPDLMADLQYYFIKTAGLIGLLKDWLTECLEQALLAGMETFDREFAERFAKPNNSLLTIVAEALEGERRLEDVGLDVVEAALLGNLPRCEAAPSAVPQKAKPSRRVGKRNPVRDPVGGCHVAT